MLSESLSGGRGGPFDAHIRLGSDYGRMSIGDRGRIEGKQYFDDHANLKYKFDSRHFGRKNIMY